MLLQYDMPPALSADEVRGLIEAVGARAGASAQRVGIRLAQGWPRSMAVIGSGLSQPQLRDLCRRDDRVSGLLQELEEAGFAMRWEGELYRRAMAGKDDRGSMRALEILLKQRDPSYHDKYSVEHHLRVEADKSMRLGGGGWQDRGDAGQFEASDGQ